MAEPDAYDARADMVAALLEKIEADQYPSSTMLDMVEELMTPEELPAYIEALVERVRNDRFPSIPMMQRIQSLM